jgi:uridine kinase
VNRDELLDTLAEKIRAIRRPHPLRVGIDGVDASGKTVLADALGRRLSDAGAPVIRASVDGFHNPREVRRRRGADSPEGYYADSFDCGALVRLLLQPLGPGGDRSYTVSVYDIRREAARRAPKQCAPSDAILVFDGVFLLRPELAAHWDYSIFLDVTFETALRRAAVRDRALFGTPEQVAARYRARYIPGQKIYLAGCRPQEYADAVVDNNDPAHPLLTLPAEPPPE